LVLVFTYFYTAITFEPDTIAENLQRSGAFVPGVRPGSSTSHYIGNIITRLTLVGAVFLGLIAVLPLAVRAATGITSIAIGGTASHRRQCACAAITVGVTAHQAAGSIVA